jgi:hypothetical protein
MLSWRAGKPSIPGGTIYYITAAPNWTLSRTVHSGVSKFSLYRDKELIGSYAAADEAKKAAEKLQGKTA